MIILKQPVETDETQTVLGKEVSIVDAGCIVKCKSSRCFLKRNAFLTLEELISVM